MITITNLCKTFGTSKAIDNLTLSIPPGELFCFLGPNGAGKTTTIKTLTGLLRPSAGSAAICGLDVQSQSLEVKRVIGYIPDTPYLYDRLTTSEFFEFTADLYNIPNDRSIVLRNELLQLFGLVEQQNMLIKDLSHGMRQRLLYATTFMHEPKVLFIDEPLIGLDPYSIRLIKDLLRSKARAGMTIFLTTHILALAEDIGDRIGIILEGRLTALGTLQQLLARNPDCINLEQVFLKLTACRKPSGLNVPTQNDSIMDSGDTI